MARTGQKPVQPTSAKACPNCGGVLTPSHECPQVREDAKAIPPPPVVKSPKEIVKPPAPALPPAPVDVRRELLTPRQLRVARAPRAPTVKAKDGNEEYKHEIVEDYMEIEGFGKVTVKKIVSVPGLAYLWNGSTRAWHLIHLPSQRVIAIGFRDEGYIESACSRFRCIDWTRTQEWFLSPDGKRVQQLLKEYVALLQDGRKAEIQSPFEESAMSKKESKPVDEFAMLEDAIASTGASSGEKIVEDELDYDVAYRFAWLGVGHAGNRLVECAYKIGYRRVLAVNTSKQDLDELDLPEDHKLCLGGKGAGKVREVGDKLMNDNYEELMDLARRRFGPSFDRIFVCASAGGGTGSGGFPTCVDCANELMKALRLPSKVGIILALPLRSERGQFENATASMKDVKVMLAEGSVSPVMLLDNERIRQIYPSVTMGKLWPTANQSIIALLHYFNRLTVQSGNKYENCDPADFGTVLDSGVIACGQMLVDSAEKTALATAFRDNLKQNLLAGGFDYAQAKKVLCLVAGPEAIIDEIPALNLDHAFESLSRVVGDAPVHRGIYAFGDKLRALSMVGGLSLPEDWLA
jgi:cell division GTPase FtsZ